MFAVSMSISAKTNTKVIANSAPGIRYNAYAVANVTPQAEIKPRKKEILSLKFLFKKTKIQQKKIASKTVFQSIQKMNVAPTIFGTTYDSKLFLTATSSLSIDKQDVSPLLTVPCISFGVGDGSLVLGGCNNWH